MPVDRDQLKEVLFQSRNRGSFDFKQGADTLYNVTDAVSIS